MEKAFRPFAKNKSSDYSYFQMNKIVRNVKFDKKTFEKALRIIETNEIQLSRVQLGYIEDDDNMYCNVNATKNDGTSYHLVFNNESVVDLYIYENGYRFWSNFPYKQLDVYETAVLILADEYIRKNNPGDVTNRSASEFLSFFRLSSDSDSRKKTVQLIPLLCTDYELFLRFMIRENSHSRPYMVRSIDGLIKCLENEETYHLGKNSEIDFQMVTFEDEFDELLKYIKKWKKDEIEQKNNSMRFYGSLPENSIKLTYDKLDKFFSLYKQTGVLNASDKKTMIKFSENRPQITINIDNITENKGVFSGISLRCNEGSVYEGSSNSYYLCDNCLYKMDSDYAEKFLPILTSKHSSGLKIGRKNLSDFYHHILPELKKIAVVQENDSETIEKYLPPEAVFRFCLDILEDKTPECRIETKYGEENVDITDLIGQPFYPDGKRDLRSESAVLKRVIYYFPNYIKEQRSFLANNDESSVFTVINEAVPQLMQLGEVCTTQRFNHLNIRQKANISVGVSIKSNLLDINVSADDIPQEELLDIIKSYRLKKKYHRMKNGDFVNIDDSIGELSAMLETMHISFKEFVNGKMQLPAYRALYLDKMLENNQEIYAKRDSNYKSLIKNFKTVTDSDFEVPDSLIRTMRGYQRYGYKWLRTLESCGFGGILADDMGLGKTLQMISVFLAAKTEEKDCTSLIICPASLVYNWAAEFEKFAPQLKICTVAGMIKERKEQIADYRSYDVLITSYDLVKRDIAEYEECAFGYQVLDEAQFIKNHTTAAAKAVKLINAEHRFALTGTPIENRLSELWSIFDYLMPGFLYGYDTFKKEFETPIVKRSDEEVTERLAKMTAPFILRRKKQDVLKDLPDKLEENYVVSLTDEQRKIYDAKVVELRQILDSSSEEGYNNIKFKILTILTQIRQICCDPSLIFDDYSGNSAKKEACMEIIERAIEGEHKMLVFSQFTSMLEIIEQELKDREISYYKITGETPKKRRLELVEAFNSDNVPVFLISLKAGGTGLNLIGADVVVHYDPWWNVAAQNQATDRAHRIGQSKKVTVYRIIAKNTIEEKIQSLQEKKKELADAVLTGETVSLSSLSKDELMEIIGG